MPLEIRGVSDLWDASTNSITPIGLGDSYELRIDLEMTATSSNPTRFTLALDIGTVQNGTNGTDSIVIVSESKTLKAGVPQRHSVSVPIFSLSNFIANNGSIWISADSGTITIAERSISLYRNSKGQL